MSTPFENLPTERALTWGEMKKEIDETPDVTDDTPIYGIEAYKPMWFDSENDLIVSLTAAGYLDVRVT